MAKKKAQVNTFRFHKNDKIGVPQAELDAEFLRECFVDTGDVALLENMADTRLIVLGRTGSGKSALLERLKQLHSDRVIEVAPEALALTHVGHSTILNEFASLGINLDPFFNLLWRHILTVEVLRRYFEQFGTQQDKSMWDWLLSFFSAGSSKDRAMQEAIRYLREWGEEFWQETEYRVKEITLKVETQLKDAVKAKLGPKFASIGADFSDLQTLSEEEKTEVIRRGQEVVSKAQVKDLHQALSMLQSILTDRQKQYYVVIDRLDENWVEEKLRYRLIMALIQTCKEFIPVANAKIIVALRRDLIDRVFRRARDAGFQEEKMEALYLQIRWTKAEIIEILDRRINHLVRRRYTKQKVSHKDLLPASSHGLEIDEYIFRIAPRPRDVIAFFNACIDEATDLARLGSNELSKAEAEYSRGRIRALADEWNADYQHLIEFAKLLQGKPSTFKADALTDDEIENFCLSIVINHPGGRGDLHSAARGLVDGLSDAVSFRKTLFTAFYRIGLVGIKSSTHETYHWATDRQSSLAPMSIETSTSIQVACPYIRALGVIDPVHRSS